MTTADSVPVERGPPVWYRALEGGRGLAALFVVIFHVASTSGVATAGDLMARAVTELGRFGVAVFFVLSGFLLYRPFFVADVDGRPMPGWGDFYRRRLLRLLPAYWVALIFAAFVLRTTIPFSDLGHVVTYFGLIEIYRPGQVFGGLGVAWTLGVELVFYAVLPVLAWMLRRMTKWRFLGAAPTPHLIGLAGLYGLAVAFRALVVDLTPTAGSQPYALWLPNHLDWFALGMALAMAGTWGERGRKLPRFVSLLVDAPAASWLLSGVFFWLTVQLHLPTGFVPADRASYLAEYLFLGWAAAFLVLPGVFDRTATVIGRFMIAPPLLYAGLVSYGIYLWHKLWLDWLIDEGVREGFWLLLVLVLVPTIVTASLSYLLVESPARRWGRAAARGPNGRARRSKTDGPSR